MSDGILVQALGDFCKRYLGDSAVVVRGYVNRVSKPKTKSYVLVTPMTMTRLSTNLHQTECGGEASVQPQRRRVQLDVYGPTAADGAPRLLAKGGLLEGDLPLPTQNHLAMVLELFDGGRVLLE